MNEISRKKNVLRCILFVLLLPISSLGGIAAMIGLPLVLVGLCWPVTLTILYLLLRKKLTPSVITVNGVVAGLILLSLTVVMVLAKGNTEGLVMSNAVQIIGWISPGLVTLLLFPQTWIWMILLWIGTPALAFFLAVFLQKRAAVLKKALPCLAGALVCLIVMTYQYVNRPSVRYGGHGFEYMHGYSSTDFSDYMVYSEPSKLVTPERTPSLLIEGEENMPKLDGAEACYPVYAAVAKAVYKDIAAIEKSYLKDPEVQAANGKIVRFTNTVRAFQKLIWPETDGSYGVDLFFGAMPSQSQRKEAEALGVELNVTPIGKEAFVFFVEPDNPVTNLTSDQIRAIYQGVITNWAEVGGKDQEILAFQRPENSGSQTVMRYFMGDVPLKSPATYEYVSSMGGVVNQVAQYANEAGAIGYSFRYFVEDLNQENDVRVIAVDGVLPTLENVKNGSYPLTTNLCLISRANDPDPNVQKMIDLMLSEAGQEIIEKTGYAGLK